MDSTTYDQFQTKVNKLTGLVDERYREMLKMVEPKLERADLDKLEKKNFAHISKMFYSI